MEAIMGIMIPIIFIIVSGLVIVTFIFYRSREKQMVIERGLDIEFIQELFKKRKHPYALLKIGIIIFFFGLGLGLGLLIKVYTGVDEWIPFLIFTGSGLGFIFAFVAGEKFAERDKNSLLK